MQVQVSVTHKNQQQQRAGVANDAAKHLLQNRIGDFLRVSG